MMRAVLLDAGSMRTNGITNFGLCGYLTVSVSKPPMKAFSQPPMSVGRWTATVGAVGRKVIRPV